MIVVVVSVVNIIMVTVVKEGGEVGVDGEAPCSALTYTRGLGALAESVPRNLAIKTQRTRQLY